MTREDWCHIGYAIVGVCVLTPLLILATDARPCVIIYGGTFEPDAASPGDKPTLRYEAEEHMACGGYVIRRFIGSDHYVKQSIQEPTNYHETIDKTRRQFSVEITVPLLPPGPAVYAPVVYRWRNPVQKFLFDTGWMRPDPDIPRVPFTVVRRADAMAPPMPR